MMGYFSELSIRLQEQHEMLMDAGGWADCSYPSHVQQLLWRLEDYKEQLREWIEDRRRWETVYDGAPRSDYETQYLEWPNHWPPRNPEAFYAIPNTLSPGEEFPLDDIMDAIASTQNRLLFYGYDADAEEARQIRYADSVPPEGQLPLPLAA